MSDEKEKKKFFETGFGKFVKKAAAVAPEILSFVPGPVGQVMDKVSDVLKKKSADDAAAGALLAELEQSRMTFVVELLTLETADRANARSREIEIKKVGGTDWLMNACGTASLIGFLFLLYAAVFLELSNETLVHQMIGVSEGVMLSVFSYYFGTSASSRRKTELMNSSPKQ